MKPQIFKQIALLAIMAATMFILFLICLSVEQKELQRSEHKTIHIGQDTVKVNKSGEVVR